MNDAPAPVASHRAIAAMELTITLGRLILETMKRPLPGISAGELYALVMPKGVTLESLEGALGLLVRSGLVARTPAGWLTIETGAGLA
jgi:hypothetical protein